MHYRNGREAHNGDRVVRLNASSGHIEAFGTLYNATPGNEYCNGNLKQEGQLESANDPYACMCDCLHIDDLADILKEKGLDKRPEGK
jgi:hypothetical protein